MQDNVTGKPNALKQVNLSMIRRAILEKGSATRAEIVHATKISVTTVRTLLTQLQNNNELVEVGFDDSIGGRKAIRYRLNEDLFFGVSLCLDDDTVRYLTVNIRSEICETGSFEITDDIGADICRFLDELSRRVQIRSIGIGVPGIVNGMGYERKNEHGELEYNPIGEVVSKRYGVPVVLENDLNAIALGFGRHYLKSYIKRHSRGLLMYQRILSATKFREHNSNNVYPKEQCENVNMAYIHFDADCLSAGFLSGGRIVRGWNNFVGELGLFPVEAGKTLDDVLAAPIDNAVYANLVAKLIAGICCILNPQYIALGGTAFRNGCLPLIIECFKDILPSKMSPEILYAEDKWHDYFEGIAYITAEHIFTDVRLVKQFDSAFAD